MNTFIAIKRMWLSIKELLAICNIKNRDINYLKLKYTSY